MEGRTFAFVATIFILGSILVEHTYCSPVYVKREEMSDLVGNSPTAPNALEGAHTIKLQRQGRYYMGYPYGGGMGFGGATASASASASASSGGMGMGYAGYPYMYGR